MFNPTRQDGRSSKPRWKELEILLNDVYREAVLERLVAKLGTHALSKLFIALDDDKVHFNMTGSSNKEHGIKRQQHVTDNRRGFTLHTAGLPGIQLPIFFRWNGINESNTDCYVVMVNQMFGCGMGSSVVENCDLRNVVFASDRGYCGAGSWFVGVSCVEPTLSVLFKEANGFVILTNNRRMTNESKYLHKDQPMLSISCSQDINRVQKALVLLRFAMARVLLHLQCQQ